MRNPFEYPAAPNDVIDLFFFLILILNNKITYPPKHLFIPVYLPSSPGSGCRPGEADLSISSACTFFRVPAARGYRASKYSMDRGGQPVFLYDPRSDERGAPNLCERSLWRRGRVDF